MLRKIGVLISLPLAIVAVACSGTAGPSGPGKLGVVATVTQVSALARAVGGDRVDLTALVTAKDDPHQYELKPDQVTRLGKAVVVFESGAGIDKWIDKGVDAAGVKDRVVVLGDGVKLKASATEGKDPHWWYDVDNAKTAADAIAAALTKADAGGKDTYQANATALKQRLDAADQKVHGLIDPVPPAKRLFVANHDAFDYFLDRYGITLVGDIVPSTDSMAAVRPADIAKLVGAIKDQHVCAIFTETTIDPKLADQIASESGAKVYDGRLYGDAIGDPGSTGATLEGALVENGTLMAAAFKSC